MIKKTIFDRSSVNKKNIQDDRRCYFINSSRISCIFVDNHSFGDFASLYERQIETISVAESSPSRLYASLLSLTACKELNN